MTRPLVGWALVLWAGAALLLAEVRWIARPSLAERLRPFAPDPASRRRPDVRESLLDVLGPLARDLGARVARAFGVQEEAALRLARIHSPLDVTQFRLRQLGAAVGALGVSAVPASVLWHSPTLALVVVASAPLLAFLVLEQHLAAQAARRRERVVLELPVVAEQLGLLLGAGWSLGASLTRLGSRGAGAVAEDLRRVSGRVRQGVAVDAALREWADLERVPALDRLVAVLAREREAGDLGRLVSEEARAIREELHRTTVATMERRAQQVWVPVTVATLVPGVVFLAIPFVEALRLFTGP